MSFTDDPLSIPPAQPLSAVLPHPETFERHVEDDEALLALQPGALFLLDDAGVILQVGGAWENVTDIPVADAVGDKLSRWLFMPRYLYPDGLFGLEGLCESAQLLGPLGPRQVRVTWQRRKRRICGQLESISTQARRVFDDQERDRKRVIALDDTLLILGSTLDSWQREHVHRITDLATRFAHALCLSGDEVQGVRWGAMLHDVGKARISPDILNKNGKLTEYEFSEIMRHPGLGHELLSRLSFLPREVFETVMHHHERFDGQGYPARLDGLNIPLAARIVSIVDVFDALTSVRPYKGAWSYQEAIEYLIEHAGTQFDPYLVRVFVMDVLGMPQLHEQLPPL